MCLCLCLCRLNHWTCGPKIWFGLESETDTQTDSTEMHIDNAKTITPSADSGLSDKRDLFYIFSETYICKMKMMLNLNKLTILGMLTSLLVAVTAEIGSVDSLNGLSVSQHSELINVIFISNYYSSQK